MTKCGNFSASETLGGIIYFVNILGFFLLDFVMINLVGNFKMCTDFQKRIGGLYVNYGILLNKTIWSYFELDINDEKNLLGIKLLYYFYALLDSNF